MILLTGATGYLGSAIARELIARRQPFRVLVRDASRLGFDPVECHCEVAVGDLRDLDALEAAVRGVDAVIHTAGLVKMWARYRDDFEHVNVHALRNLLQAAGRAGVRRVVYTSSFMALGPSGDVNAGESLRNAGPYANEYEKSKSQALEWLRCDGIHQFPVIVMLPGVVYGPGPRTDGNLMGGMIDQYLAGKFPGIPGPGRQRWSFAYIADVAAAHLTAVEKGKPGEAYLLGGDNRSLNDFFRIVADFSRVERPVRHIPFPAAKIAAAIELMRARLSNHSPRLTPGVVDIFKRDWVYSSAKAIRELNYRVAPLEAGLQETLEGKTPQPAAR
jgi:farnesol dehydrogenase